MRRAVLISIQPKWCDLIASGKKTVEVRKSFPHIVVPFKCYIYCTKAPDNLLEVMHDGDDNYGTVYHGKPVFVKTSGNTYGWLWHRQQKVIGEFICDWIEMLDMDSVGLFVWRNGEGRYLFEIGEDACLTREEVIAYCGMQRPFGWHISNLKIYDQPKPLSEFQRACDHKEDCCTCKRWNRKEFQCIAGITRPPQSWMYVEETE